MNPNTTENNWSSGTKWNQTADLTIDGNCFTLTSTALDNGTGTWKTIDNPTEPITQPTTNPTNKIISTLFHQQTGKKQTQDSLLTSLMVHRSHSGYY